MTPKEVLRQAIVPALGLLPKAYDTPKARVQILAVGGQESDLKARRQYGGGPARSLWQFELGTQATRGGVWGIFMHALTRNELSDLCRFRDVAFTPRTIHTAIEYDDILAAGCARLLLLTDAHPLPAIGDEQEAWEVYLRTWRPGKPRPAHWPANYAAAVAAVAVQ